MNYYLRRLLTDEDLQVIREYAFNADYEDGLVSYDGTHSIKKLFQAVPSESKKEMSSLIMASLDRDKKFLGYTTAKTSGLPHFSRVNPGGYYKPHQDNHQNGNFSTTVFLSDPDEYVGGELCLMTGMEVEKIKPPAGWAITYPTGLSHAVAEVTSGVRHVSVFWSTSVITDPAIRDILYDLWRVDQAVKDSDKVISEDDLSIDNCEQCPSFMLAQVREKILRTYNRR